MSWREEGVPTVLACCAAQIHTDGRLVLPAESLQAPSRDQEVGSRTDFSRNYGDGCRLAQSGGYGAADLRTGK